MPEPKILIVDDHIGSLQTLICLLEKYHPEYRLYQSTNGRAAIDLIISNAIDLVITDWDMPGFSGIDLVDAVKSEEKTRHIPIIIVTGVMVSPSDIQTALSRGAHDYLQKPVDPVELSARVHSAFMLSCIQAKELEKKNVALVEKALTLTRNYEFIKDLANQLKNLVPLVDEQTVAGESLNKIIRETEQKLHYEIRQQFDIAFQNVHKSFIQNLLGKYPGLETV
ncbi:MAG: response regulator [Bacteroidetes bacterium]|nr:response regulator [Bacteroidota bacterium]